MADMLADWDDSDDLIPPSAQYRNTDARKSTPGTSNRKGPRISAASSGIRLKGATKQVPKSVPTKRKPEHQVLKHTNEL